MYKAETQFPFSFHFSTKSRTHIFLAYRTYNILICILERITELDIITSVIAISFCALRIIAEREKKNGKWKRERDEKRKGERDEQGRRDNVAFVRDRNSYIGYIEHFTMTRYERLDEQRAGKEGDEREIDNKRLGSG